MKVISKKLLIFGIAVMLSAAVLAAVLAQGIWDESKAVHISPDEIEDSTLAVGTHLIHLSALTDSIYDIALSSAHESRQEQIYYKSELADGTWFDITTATSLSEITTDGEAVNSDTIKSLYFTHHTKSDGITYDLRTNQAVNIYDIRDPYDLENMEELAPLKNQFDLMDQMLGNYDKSDSDDEENSATPNEEELTLNIERCARLFQTKTENAETQSCDSKMKALQNYSADKDGDILSEAQKIMDSLDAQRRIAVLNQVSDRLDELTSELNHDEVLNTMMQSAANDSISNVQASLVENEAKILSPGSTVVSRLYYELANEAAESPSDAVFSQLVILEHIRSGNVIDRNNEIAMLDEILISRATGEFTALISSGATSEYAQAAARGDHDTLLNRIITEAMGDVNSMRGELEYFITARCERSGNDDGMKHLDNRLKLSNGWYSTVPNDAFKSRVDTCIDDHIEFLTKMRRDMELSAGGNETDALIKQKKQLQTEMLSALDKNDLETAKKLENEINSIDDKLNSINEELSAKSNELNSQIDSLQKELDEAKSAETPDLDKISELQSQLADKKSELSELNSSMSDGTLGAAVYDLKQQCLDIINGDDLGSDRINTLSNNINSLIDMLSMNQKLIFPDLKELHEAMALNGELKNTDAFDEALESIDDAIKNNRDGYKASLQTEMTSDELLNLFDNWLDNTSEISKASSKTGNPLSNNSGDTGSSLSNNSSGANSTLSNNSSDADSAFSNNSGDADSALSNYSDEASAVFCIALQKYYDTTESQGAKSLLNSICRRQTELGNHLIFPCYNEGSVQYIPITALADFTGMRYVYYAGQGISTLAKGSSYYSFTAHSNKVIRSAEKNSEDIMPRPTVMKSVLYIPEEYAFEQFNVQVLCITNKYGVLVSEKYQRLADNLLSLMLT